MTLVRVHGRVPAPAMVPTLVRAMSTAATSTRPPPCAAWTAKPSLTPQGRMSSLPFAIHGSTIECHGDDGIEQHCGDVAPPLHPTTTFLTTSGQVYSRMDNVTRQRVEAVIGGIEGGLAVTYSSGLSAVTALIHCVKPARVFIDAGYHGVRAAFRQWGERQVGGGRVDVLTLEQVKEIYDRNTMHYDGHTLWSSTNTTTTTDTDHANDSDNGRSTGVSGDGARSIDLIWLESPNNPYSSLIDIEWYAELARRTGACLACDSTLASSLSLRPLEWGCHVVMHSSTKYLSGHSDLLGGVLVVRPSLTQLHATLLSERSIDGAVMGNLETWLLLRSLRTFSLRVQRQCANTVTIVQWLEQQRQTPSSKIKVLHHPSLPSHDSYHLYQKYLRLPPATFSIELQSESQAKSFAQSLVLAQQATSLGGVETLVDWRYMYDTSVSPALLRISIGVEEADDLIADFAQALEQAH